VATANSIFLERKLSCEARAYAVARKYDPLLVNTVVGFIGPEYLFVDQPAAGHWCGGRVIFAPAMKYLAEVSFLGGPIHLVV
jgi:hypothetical protein